MKRRLVRSLLGIAAIALCVGGVFGFWYYDRTVLADKAFRAGNSSFQSRDYAGAESHFSVAIRKMPEGASEEADHKLSVVYSRRAEVRVELDRFEEALQDFSHAIRLSPASSMLYVVRGKAYLRQRQFDAADSDFAQSVAKNNSNSAAVYYLGLSAEKQGRLEVAAIHYRKSIEMNPETAKYLAALSRVLGKAGDKAGSADFAEKARKLFPAESFAIEEP